jgi:hypothetical protein
MQTSARLPGCRLNALACCIEKAPVSLQRLWCNWLTVTLSRENFSDLSACMVGVPVFRRSDQLDGISDSGAAFFFLNRRSFALRSRA